LRQIGQQRIATTIGFVNLTLQPIQVWTTDEVKNIIMSLLNNCFNTKKQRHCLWNQQKFQFHSILKLNIDIFENKIHNPQ
jgi:hypothetical protein